MASARYGPIKDICMYVSTYVCMKGEQPEIYLIKFGSIAEPGPGPTPGLGLRLLVRARRRTLIAIAFQSTYHLAPDASCTQPSALQAEVTHVRLQTYYSSDSPKLKLGNYAPPVRNQNRFGSRRASLSAQLIMHAIKACATKTN